MDEKDAATVADSLTIADARGVYSHGIMRTPIYAERIRCGGTSATAKPEIIKEFGATALVDAHNAMGQVAGVYSSTPTTSELLPTMHRWPLRRTWSESVGR